MIAPADSLSQTPEQPEEEAPRKKRKPSGGFECKLGLLLGLCGLAASRLGRLWIAFDVFSQFTLQFAVITVAFLIGWAMPRAKLLSALVVLVLGIVAIGAWPHLASREARVLATAQQGERALKVARFNTLWVNQNADAVKAEIERLDADIIVLIEMGPPKRRILADLKGRYPNQFHCFTVDYCNIALHQSINSLQRTWMLPMLFALFWKRRLHLSLLCAIPLRVRLCFAPVHRCGVKAFDFRTSWCVFLY